MIFSEVFIHILGEIYPVVKPAWEPRGNFRGGGGGVRNVHEACETLYIFATFKLKSSNLV